MGSSVDGTPLRADERLELAALWLDDLRWHRHMFRESRFRWTRDHVSVIVARHTAGQLEFTTVRHLERLQRRENAIRAYGHQCRLAMAEPLRAAQQTLSGGWAPTTDALGLTLVECKATVWFAVGSAPETRTNLNVERVLAHLPFTNPLIQCWELTQLWRMYEAAADVVDDVICDLVEELRPGRPTSVLARATGHSTPSALDARVAAAREARGEPGDPRRIPQQQFWPARTTLTSGPPRDGATAQR